MPINIPSLDCLSPSNKCGDQCPVACPDHTIRRHDTRPPFRVSVEDCDGPLDLEGLVVEANMWANAKLKVALTPDDGFIQLVDGVGFDQVLIDDIIIMDRVRRPEHLLVTDFDEDQRVIKVQRGYNGTTPSKWKKGQKLRIFRILNAPGTTEATYEDRDELDGTKQYGVLTESFLVYEWRPEDTALPGCYFLEFKVLKMKDQQFFLPGGSWVGTVHTDPSGDFLTGEFATDSSVRLSLSPLERSPNAGVPAPAGSGVVVPRDWRRTALGYLIPRNVHWSGPVHLWTDSNWYTGTGHDDGSVYLDINGVVSPDTASYNEDGLVGLAMLCETSSTASLIPSFTGVSYTSISQVYADYDVALGAGVEWVRRFPVVGEGFSIWVVDSPTAE